MSEVGPTKGTESPGPARRHRHRRRPTRRQRWRTVLISVVAVLTAATGLGIGVTTWTTSSVAGNVDQIGDAFPSGQRPEPEAAAEDALTLLVAAVEPAPSARDGVQAEAVLLVRFTGDRQHAQVVFLPLNAWLAAARTTPDSAFASGGSAELVEAVETETGVRMDHYAQIDFDGLASIVDTLGGVDVDVPQPYSFRSYSFPAGVQHLDGAAAVAYVRDADDAARATTPVRMQAMIQALFDRLGQQGLLSDFGRLSSALGELTSAIGVDDTLASTDLVRLAWDMRGARQPDFVLAPVSGEGSEDGQPVSRLDPQRAEALWTHMRADDLAQHVDEFG